MARHALERCDVLLRLAEARCAKMKVLVTGANGLVGRSLCAALCRQDYAVVAALRSANTLLEDVERVIVGTIDHATDWSAALRNVDTIIHLAARVHVMHDAAVDPLAEFRKVNVDGTLHLALQAAKAGVKRFIFISSVKVNGEHTVSNKPFTEVDVAKPQDAYGISKFEAEQGLLLIAQQTGMEVVIIRPPLVYGSGVKANFASMLRAVKRGMPLPLGAIHNKRSFVYVGNLVSLILRCVDHPAAANQVFLVSDGHDLSTTELLRACAVALGVKPRLLPVPQSLIEIGAALLCKGNVAQRLCGNLQVDISKARNLLGWTPPISVADGLKATVLGIELG
jgi:nucleoside-diphosphate-sugar epimerase